jgi:hypothetical protein
VSPGFLLEDDCQTERKNPIRAWQSGMLRIQTEDWEDKVARNCRAESPRQETKGEKEF